MRTTGVRLIADIDQWKRSFKSGAAAVRDLKDKVQSVNNPLKDLTKNAVQSSKEISRSQKLMNANIDEMDRRIAESKRHLQALSTSYVQGNKDAVKQIKEEQKKLTQLTSIRKLLPGLPEMTKAGVEAGRRFDIGFLSIAKSTAISLGSILGGAVVAGLPFIGGVLAATIIGGAGIGGVIGGIAIAAKDPRVKEAGRVLGVTLLEDLQTRAQHFFVVPLLGAIKRVQLAFNGMGSDLDRILIGSAKFLQPLTQALSFFVQRVVKGLANLVDVGGPVIEALSQGIADLGEAIYDIFDSLTDNGREAAIALNTFFNVFITTLRLAGAAINALTESFGFLVKIGAFGREAQLEYVRLTANAKIAAEGNKTLAGTFGTVRNAGNATATAIGSLATETLKLGGPRAAAAQASDAHARAMRGEVGAMKDLNDALRAQIDPLFAFTQAQKKVKEAQDAATEAIKKHGANSSQARNATRELAGAALDLQQKAAGLSSGFNGKLTPAMRDTFKAAGLTKGEIKLVEKQLIEARKAADKYEGKYVARVDITGDKKVGEKLTTLSQIQQALKKGTNLPMRARAYFGDRAGFHDGGYTGPGGKYEPAGVVHRDEYVIRKESRAKIEKRNPGLLDEMNATGQIPGRGYAVGGQVGWPYPVDASKTKVMTVEQAINAVVPNFGAWPSSPAAQRGDSGVWRRIVGLINATGPMSGRFGNAYRAGDPKWHGSGRAVDWMGFNQDRLASFLSRKRPLELIHRTRNRDYAYTRGRNVGSFNESLMNAHRNHVHIAMAGGGLIAEPVLGVGASGATYSFAENGPERVLSATQTAAGGGAGVVNNIQVSVHAPVGSHPREIGRQIAMHLQSYMEGGGRLVVNGQPVIP